jgi:hypothetical protein
MVRRPVRNLGLDFVPSGLPGVGVDDLSALRFDTEPFFPLNQDMFGLMRNYKECNERKPAFFEG